MEFNINHYVKVKLTEVGVKEMERQHLELKQAFPKLHEFRPPAVDSDGYSSFQMHSLMNTFGHMTVVGFELPFLPDIKLEVLEKTSKVKI